MNDSPPDGAHAGPCARIEYELLIATHTSAVAMIVCFMGYPWSGILDPAGLQNKTRPSGGGSIFTGGLEDAA